MPHRRSRDEFYPYVMQIGDNETVLYVNFARDVNKAVRGFYYRHPRLDQSVLRQDLFDQNSSFSTGNQAKKGCLRLIYQLETNGYEVIAGGPLHNPYWRVYVIEINGDPHHLYVGETNYPVEKRFQQHIYMFNSARVLKRFDVLELNMQHAEHLPIIKTKAESLEAEATLARELRAQGYRVEGGH